MTALVHSRITDAVALREVAPAALRSYVIAQGWNHVERYGTHSDVYAREGAEIIVPGTASLGDYASVVATLTSIIADVEGRDELQVFLDLVTSDRDVIRVRAPRANDDGSVAIDEGVSLVVHARNLLLSSACSAWEPKATYRAGKVRKAEDYMNHVRLGQTERGSFVVTLLSPVPPALEQPLQPTLWPMEEDEPYERLVTRKFMDGLIAAKKAIEQFNRGATFEVFENAVSSGVSANLCDAAARLVESGDGADISVTWARTRRTPEERRSITLVRAEGEVLKEAARLFHEKQPRPDERLEGFVTKLGREESAFDGNATLKAYVDDRIASIHVQFPQQMYERAIEAHRSKRPVVVTGTLEKSGRRWVLKAPTDLHVGADDDGDEPS